MVIGGMVMVNMAKVLVIERPRVPKIPISLRFVCFMFVYLHNGPSERNNLEFHLIKTAG